MATIYRRDVRYQEPASASLLEREYEEMLEHNAPVVFPGLVMVPFKTTVTSELGARKPDFALLDKEYRKWWVVEVELAHHPFAGHVLPQVEVLATASYGEREAQYLASHNPTVEIDRLRSMMLGAQPQTLVIVNAPCPAWERELRMLDALLMTVALFRSDRNDYVLLVEGQAPEVHSDVLTRCRRSRLLPRFWEVESPGGLPMDPGEAAAIRFEGRTMTWRRIDTGDTAFLAPEGASDSLGSETNVVELVIVEGVGMQFRKG